MADIIIAPGDTVELRWFKPTGAQGRSVGGHFRVGRGVVEAVSIHGTDRRPTIKLAGDHKTFPLSAVVEHEPATESTEGSVEPSVVGDGGPERTYLSLRPSEYRLASHDGGIQLLPMWETVGGDLIWCRTGVTGSKAPIDPVTGRVPCRYVDLPTEIPHFNAGGVIRGETISVVGVGGAHTTMLVGTPDGLLESKPVCLYDGLELL